ncbi:MAG: ParB/RepB/Spo0J family partition protein [bacterium]|nr:ParB/RepB/Spo0J family partition protein [bacterium]
MKRKALGKGLSSLIPQAPPRTKPSPTKKTPGVGDGILRLDTDKIRPNRGQPRQDFDQEALEELAGSLKRDGVLQPVLVRPLGGDEYELIAGERRWRAAQLAGLLKVPAIVRETPDEQLLEIALIENIQREELNAIEEARAYQTLIDDHGLTQQELADRVGKRRTTITNALRLLNLPLAVQDLVRDGLLTSGHAKAIAAITNTERQVALAKRAVDDGLSVRDLEAQAGRAAKAATAKQQAPARDPNVVAAEERLEQSLGTKVRILPGRRGGRVEVHYYSEEELDRVFQIMVSGARA